MTGSDLDALLAEEIERRLPILENEASDHAEIRAALHTFRGSAAMAGHADLSLVVGAALGTAAARRPECTARGRGNARGG